MNKTREQLSKIKAMKKELRQEITEMDYKVDEISLREIDPMAAKRMGNEVCRVRMTLDTRRANKDGRFPVAVWVLWLRQRTYLSMEERLTIEEYYDACNQKARRISDDTRKTRASMDEEFDAIIERIETLMAQGRMSAEYLKGFSLRDRKTLKDFWQDFAGTKSVGAAIEHRSTLKRFFSDMGDKVGFDDLNRDLIETWRDIMLTKGAVSISTANMYLRMLRSVMNEAYRQGYVKHNPSITFHGFKLGICESRRHCFLNVEGWRKIWEFYKSNGEGLKMNNRSRSACLDGVGLALFSYLANGMNAMDMACLKYDEFYYANEGKMMRFVRHKTEKRTATEVVFPVLPEMRAIIERQGLPEKRGGYVFRYMENRPIHTKDEEMRGQWNASKCINQAILMSMREACDALGIRRITATYCRHSFATNLKNAGVPKEYISEAMGHAIRDITDHYLGGYDYDTMRIYNSKLLGNGDDEQGSLSNDSSNPEIRNIADALKYLQGVDKELLKEFLGL